ncbi:unnamed protein product, partial [Caenorhabditis brenneri]
RKLKVEVLKNEFRRHDTVTSSKCIEDQLKRNNSLLHQEIRELKNTISDLKNNTKDDLEREEGELDDSDDDEKDIQANICGLNKDNMSRGRSKGIVIKVQKEDRYPNPTMGLLHANNRKNEFMEMGSIYEFAVHRNRNTDKEVKNCIHSYKAVDWHGVRIHPSQRFQPSQDNVQKNEDDPLEDPRVQEIDDKSNILRSKYFEKFHFIYCFKFENKIVVIGSY